MSKIELEEISLDQDIPLVYTEAKSFPEGIMAAFEVLKTLLSGQEVKKYYGISHPVPGRGIVYKAGAELVKNQSELSKELQKMVLKAGKYHCKVLQHIHQDPSQIGEVFEQMIHQPDIDPMGSCIEVYETFGADTVTCLVRKLDK